MLIQKHYNINFTGNLKQAGNTAIFSINKAKIHMQVMELSNLLKKQLVQEQHQQFLNKDRNFNGILTFD